MADNKKKWIRALVFLGFLGALFLIGRHLTSTPGISVPAAQPSEEESELAQRMRRHVEAIAQYGERRVQAKQSLDLAQVYLEGQLRRMGYKVTQREFQVKGIPYVNLEVEVPGGSLSDEIVVLGAHYDTTRKTPGGDDNASGCAVLLELANELRGEPSPRTLRMVFFSLGERPHLHSDEMGSRHWIQETKQRGDNVIAMLSLDSLGVYYDHPNSQSYPPLLGFYYPDQGDFVGFLGDFDSQRLLQTSVRLFRGARRMPAEGLVVPSWAPGASASDHWSFWQEGIPALLVTDTMGWRNKAHHEMLDTYDGLDFERMALVVSGLVEVCRGLLLPASI